ncbi:DUF6059 family protein [Streptomyces sp. IBSNAI002]|uniref:DUF6059 family protein n=1 Tax=Streptomyces sp. IBSNAI002 TaxID=3457500 RepID=UPI003FD1FBC8
MRPGRRPSITRRWAGVVWQGLVSFGTLHLNGEIARAEHRPGPAPLDCPPPGHPERLRPDVPFTPVERALLRDLQSRRPVR